MELLQWDYLGTYAGAAFAVALITQVTKGIPGIQKLPTQLWSYLLALGTLLLAQVFGSGLTVSAAVLTLFDAAMVSLAANGGYAAVVRMKNAAGTDAGADNTDK